MDASKEKKAAKARWQASFKKALDADSWGQTEEAAEEYETLGRLLDSTAKNLVLGSDEKNFLQKFRAAIALRSQALNDLSNIIKHEEIKKLQELLDNLFTSKALGAFPIALKDHTEHKEEELKDEDAVVDEKELGTLLPAVKAKPGDTTLSIKIDKIGLKDAQDYLGPYLTVSVVDGKGNILEQQDTPKSRNKKPQYVLFDTEVHIQTHWDKINESGYTIFFEFKHFKAAKKKNSVRCYAFMEKGEVKNGAIALELYKKPTDFSRKNVHLFTIKQLFLTMNVTLTKH
jgi:hypothetical protein